MNKTLFICGDSFCTLDPKYGDSWASLFAKQNSNINVINLADTGASNYLIFLQVKYAIEQNCDYLIYHATSSIRQEFATEGSYLDNNMKDHYLRYCNISTSDILKPMISASWITADVRAKDILTAPKGKNIKNFFKEFIDMPSLVMKNYIFINYTLQTIANSKTIKNWSWSRGGFEHQSFGNTLQWDFTSYENKECNINLWNYADPAVFRPYYHVTDKNVIKSVCDQYINMLELNNV